MAQTLRFNLDVEQSQIASAVSTLQSGLANQLQTGSLQLSGMYGGMGQVMANMSRQAGGRSHAGMHQGYSMDPMSLVQRNAISPFQNRRETFGAYMQNAMKDIHETAVYATKKYASKIEPPKISAGQYFGNKLVDATLNIGSTAGLWTGGMALGSAMLKGAVGGPMGMAFGMGAGYLFDKAGGGKLLKGAGSWIKSLWGGNKAQEGSAYRQEIMAKNKMQVQSGAAMMRLMGQAPGITKQSQSEYFRRMMSTGKMMEEISQQFKMPMRDMMQVITAGTISGRITPQMLKKGTTPALRQMFSDQIKDLTQGASGMGVGAVEYAKADLANQTYSNWKQLQRKAPSPWALTGNRLGTMGQIGKQFGRQLMYAAKPMATTTMNLNSEERKWLGGGLGAGAMYAQQAMNNMRPGQPGFMAMAALSQGINPTDMTQALPGIAAAFSDPSKMFTFTANTQKLMRQMTGKGVEAVFAQQQISRAKWIQKTFAPNASVHDIMTSGFISQGMSPTQSRAMSSMALRQGDPIVYSKGGAKVTDPEQYVDEAMKITGGSREATLKMLKEGNHPALAKFSKLRSDAEKRGVVGNAFAMARILQKEKSGKTLNAAEQAAKDQMKKDGGPAWKLAKFTQSMGIDATGGRDQSVRIITDLTKKSLEKSQGFLLKVGSVGLAGQRGGSAQRRALEGNLNVWQDLKEAGVDVVKKTLADAKKSGVYTGLAGKILKAQNMLKRRGIDKTVTEAMNDYSVEDIKKIKSNAAIAGSKAKSKNTRDLVGVLKNLHTILVKMTNDPDLKV